MLWRLWDRFALWLAYQGGRAGRCSFCRRLTANCFVGRNPDGSTFRECLGCVAARRVIRRIVQKPEMLDRLRERFESDDLVD